MDSMETRRNAIVDLINENGTVSFSQLKDAFPNVSEMTLRTDLKLLDESKRILRIHGGAKSVQVLIGTDDFLNRKSVRNIPQKQKIAEKALTLLRPDTTVFLDSGSIYHRTGTPVSQSVQPDLHHVIKLRHGTCQLIRTDGHASGREAKPLQPERLWFFRHQRTGEREFSSIIPWHHRISLRYRFQLRHPR